MRTTRTTTIAVPTRVLMAGTPLRLEINGARAKPFLEPKPAQSSGDLGVRAFRTANVQEPLIVHGGGGITPAGACAQPFHIENFDLPATGPDQPGLLHGVRDQTDAGAP